jgi:hypothetical protein
MAKTPTYIPLATITLGSASNSITFGSVPTTYRDLIVIIDGATASSCLPVMQLNGNLSSIYSLVGMGDDAGAGFSQAQILSYFNPIPGYAVTGKFSAIWQIMDYPATDKHKSILVRVNQHAGGHVHAGAGRWASTSAINSVRLTTSNGANYSIGTTMSLYGIH